MDPRELAAIEEHLDNGYYYVADAPTLRAMRLLLEHVKQLQYRVEQLGLTYLLSDDPVDYGHG